MGSVDRRCWSCGKPGKEFRVDKEVGKMVCEECFLLKEKLQRARHIEDILSIFAV